MNPPAIDRASSALTKKLGAMVRARAEHEMKKQAASMSAIERAKLTRLLSNIKSLGDVGKAAGKSRVGRGLLDKWMNMPGVSWKINTALNEAQGILHSEDTAEGLLLRTKIIPRA